MNYWSLLLLSQFLLPVGYLVVNISYKDKFGNPMFYGDFGQDASKEVITVIAIMILYYYFTRMH